VLPPLRSNDLFGGAHLGQDAERIHGAQSFKIRRQWQQEEPRKAADQTTRSDSTIPTRSIDKTTGTKPREVREAQPFSRERFNVDFSDNQTFNIVGA
jgi:hypothetical protein